MVYTYIYSLKIHNCVILTSSGYDNVKVFISMSKKIDITPFIYIAVMVIVFALGINS